MVACWNVLEGDCRMLLKQLKARGVHFDSAMTDPPYHLTSITKRFGDTSVDDDNDTGKRAKTRADGYARLSGGFMGKKWDGGDVAFQPDTWRAVYDVLKPGAYLVAFASTRGYHRMVCAIEDAGFIIHPMLAWVFGCLSDDTKIATEDGEKYWYELSVGERVICYNAETSEYSLESVQEVVTYDINDTCFRIQSDHTDQLVSRNHRCIVERGGRESFQYAETLECQETVPVLASVSELREAILSAERGSLSQNNNMQSAMRVGFDQSSQNSALQGTPQTTIRADNKTLLSVSDSTLGTEVLGKEEQKSLLQSQLSSQTLREGLRKTRTQRSGSGNTRRKSTCNCRHDWIKQPGLERRYYLHEKKGKLPGAQIRQMSAGVSSDVSEGWLCGRAPTCHGTDNRALFDTTGIGTSYRPQFAEKCEAQPHAIRDESEPQTVRAWVGHNSTVATVTPQSYRGTIWCVRVRTGAFVAVRSGKAFITGNSGFPKGTDVSKQIDKRLGGKRRVVGKSATVIGSSMARDSVARNSFGDEGWKTANVTTVGGTSEAQRWEGWKYGLQSLKPAMEPICLAQKPMDGSGVDNILKHGVGALNIGACRVDGTVSTNPAVRNTQGYRSNGLIQGATDQDAASDGRYPANLIHDGSPEVLELFPQADGAISNGRRGVQGLYQDGIGVAEQAPSYGDTGSAARFFYTSKADADDRAWSRHPTVKPIDLMHWLTRLVTPPGGTILDPFAGSGTTIQAAVEQGFNAVGCEMQAEYILDIERRMSTFCQWYDRRDPFKLERRPLPRS